MRTGLIGVLVVFQLFGAVRLATAETVTFEFASVGIAYSAAMFADDPRIGKQIEGARIVLEVETYSGWDAANFFTDILLPIEPRLGNSAGLVYTGEALGWSGSGVFRYEIETSQLDGTFIARRYGAETPRDNFSGRILAGTIELNVPTYVRGDFDDDLDLDLIDIEQLSAATRSEEFSRRYDLNDDTLIDQEDRRVWVELLKGTWFGDADLDGLFDSSDLVDVFQAGLYEDHVKVNASWDTGDWDGDGEFASSDLVLAFQDGGYERGPRPQPELVPEPGAITLVVNLALSLAMSRGIIRRHPPT